MDEKVATEGKEHPWLIPRPGENRVAFEAFQFYLKSPRPRKFLEVYRHHWLERNRLKSKPADKSRGFPTDASSKWKEWRDFFEWEKRALEYDLYMDKLVQDKEEEAIALATAQRIALREKRKQQMEEDGFKLYEQLKARAEQMLSFPLTKQTVQEDGAITIIQPAKWTFATALRMFVEANKLGRLALGMDTELIHYDFSKCSAEEMEILRSVFGIPRGSEDEEGSDPETPGDE